MPCLVFSACGKLGGVPGGGGVWWSVLLLGVYLTNACPGKKSPEGRGHKAKSEIENI